MYSWRSVSPDDSCASLDNPFDNATASLVDSSLCSANIDRSIRVSFPVSGSTPSTQTRESSSVVIERNSSLSASSALRHARSERKTIQSMVAVKNWNTGEGPEPEGVEASNFASDAAQRDVKNL